MSEYTPGLAAIREHYVWMHGDPSKGDAGERFDREIAEVERAAAARALEEAANERERLGGLPNGAAIWLRARAAEIREEQ